MRACAPSSSTKEPLHVYEDDFTPPISFRRTGSLACPGPLLLLDALSRKSLSYNKLPQVPIKLTVVKLDGSSFGIEVMKMGTVAELKQAVEAAFSHLPQEGPGKVSWPSVWGNFCLCYDHQKLLTDSDCIGCYGIQEGDKLYFMRHRSINYNMIKRQSEKKVSALEQPRMSSCNSVGCQGREKNNYVDQGNLKQRQDGGNTVVAHCEFRLPQLLKGWFSYRRLTNSETKFKQKNSSSRLGFLGSFRNLVHIPGDKNDSQRETWKGD